MENICEYTDKGIKKRYFTIGDKINSNDAYLIGYMACDGGYITNRKWPFMMINSTNKHLIDWVKENYLPDATVYNLGKKSSEVVNAVNDIFEIRFPSKSSNQFKRFGIFCKKVERRLIGIPKSMMFPYIAGVIDADGFITVTHRHDCRTPRLRFFITHGSEKYLADLQNWLPIPTTLRQHGDNVWRLQSQNTSENILFLSNVLQFLKDHKKSSILSRYLNKFVPQASDELLEPKGISSQATVTIVEGSETTGEV